jgi:hypothetical protein
MSPPRIIGRGGRIPLDVSRASSRIRSLGELRERLIRRAGGDAGPVDEYLERRIGDSLETFVRVGYLDVQHATLDRIAALRERLGGVYERVGRGDSHPDVAEVRPMLVDLSNALDDLLSPRNYLERNSPVLVSESAPSSASTLSGEPRFPDLPQAIEEASAGTVRASRSPGDPDEINAATDPAVVRENADLPEPRRLRPPIGSPESLEAARLAGIPDEVLHSGTVLTNRDFADIVPDRVPNAGRPAPESRRRQYQPRRGVAGLRPTTDPFPADRPPDVQNTEVWADSELVRLAIERAGGHVEPIINRTQQSGPIDAPVRASQYTRPDQQLPIIDAMLREHRIVIEYDRAPGTRSMHHAREILLRDPDAIVILKIIGFDSGRPMGTAGEVE